MVGEGRGRGGEGRGGTGLFSLARGPSEMVLEMLGVVLRYARCSIVIFC